MCYCVRDRKICIGERRHCKKGGSFYYSKPIPAFTLEESVYSSVIVNQLPLGYPPKYSDQSTRMQWIPHIDHPSSGSTLPQLTIPLNNFLYTLDIVEEAFTKINHVPNKKNISFSSYKISGRIQELFKLLYYQDIERNKL